MVKIIHIEPKRVLKIFYRNPISGKWEFNRTCCVYCGKRTLIRKRNIGQNRFGDKYFYCETCLNRKNIVKEALFPKYKLTKE